MVKERYSKLTRANVIQLGLVVFLIGAILYGGFRFFGFDSASAGISAEALLILVVFAWTGSYLLRVVTGKMTFIEQRKRYREAYEQLTSVELKKRFDLMSEQEQKRLIEELEMESNILLDQSD